MEAGELWGAKSYLPLGENDTLMLVIVSVMWYYGGMKFGHKALANGSVWKNPSMPDYQIRIRFARILPRRCRIPTGGSVWVYWEQYGVLERLGRHYDWNGMDFHAWSHVANVTLDDLKGMEQVG